MHFIRNFGPCGLRAPCVLAYAMCSSAIVITIIHSFLAQAACVRHAYRPRRLACAMCSLAIVITIIHSFSLFFSPSVFCFWPTLGNLPSAKICFPQYFGITRRDVQKKIFFLLLSSYSSVYWFSPTSGKRIGKKVCSRLWVLFLLFTASSQSYKPLPSIVPGGLGQKTQNIN